MAVPSDYTDEEIAEVIEDCQGYMLAIAERLDCKPGSIRNRIFNNPVLRDILIECEEAVSDDAERYLIEAIHGRSAWAIKYWLSRKARNRGYGHKLEVQATVDGNSVVRVYEFPDDGREGNDANGNDTPPAGTTDASS